MQYLYFLISAIFNFHNHFPWVGVKGYPQDNDTATLVQKEHDKWWFAHVYPTTEHILSKSSRQKKSFQTVLHWNGKDSIKNLFELMTFIFLRLCSYRCFVVCSVVICHMVVLHAHPHLNIIVLLSFYNKRPRIRKLFIIKL